MKVVAFNGSPRNEGNTYHALKILTEQLEKEGIETEIIQVGNKAIRGCTACGQCAVNKNEKCVLPDDGVNGWIQKMKDADGIVLGSPVHYAAIASTMKSFLDRAFYVCSKNDGLLRHKVGTTVAAVRRTGGISTFNQLNNYINYSEMLIPTSSYWNIVHGTLPGEMLEDKEGVQIMRVLGQNMAWLMKLVDNGKGTVEEPPAEAKIFTNFIR